MDSVQTDSERLDSRDALSDDTDLQQLERQPRFLRVARVLPKREFRLWPRSAERFASSLHNSAIGISGSW